MSSFDESLHPRGQVANAGQFTAKTNTAPAGTLTVPEEPAPYATPWNGEEGVMIASGTNPWLQGPDGQALDFGSIPRSPQMHDLTGDDCDCEDGPMSGVLVGMDTPDGIQRCDACERFDSDLTAAQALASRVNSEDESAQVTVWFTPAADPASGLVRLRTDQRLEVADHAVANATYGCQADDWCVLADDHAGDCSEDREEWAGADTLYASSPAPVELRAQNETRRAEDGEAARFRTPEHLFVDGVPHPGDDIFEQIWETDEGGFGKVHCQKEVEELKGLRTALAEGRIRPRDIIGTGYRGDTRKLAYSYLDRMQAIYERALEVRGRNLSVNVGNVDYRLRQAARDAG